MKSVRNVNGYRVIYFPDHPRAMTSANWLGYVYEHIVIAERFLGRALLKNEVVHHLDHDRSNNRSTNLLVLDRGQHGKLHAWLAAGAPICESGRMNRVNSVKSKVKKPKTCAVCTASLQWKQKQFCSPDCCQLGTRKTERPTAEKLKCEIEQHSWCELGRRYGVSDNAVRKWARAYGLLG